MPPRIVVRVLFMASQLALFASVCQAQSSDDVFNARTLHTLNLSINTRDLALLHEDYRENTFYPMQLEWEGVVVRNAAVRSRGTGSRNPVKLGLQIEFGRFVAGQQFLGLDGLVLDNLWQDPAMIRESLTMALFERLGQPAPRESYARVYINGEYQGLYAMVEPIDARFLARVYGTDKGYVFEYHWIRSFYGEYLGPDVAPYEDLFEPRTHQTDGALTLYQPIAALFREVNEPDSATWRSSVEQMIDIPQFLTHAAIEEFVAEWDGLTGYAGMNNFYLYRPPDNSRHQFIVWDRDNAFQDPQTSVIDRADENILLRRMLAYPDLHDAYLDAVKRAVRAAAAGKWLGAEIDWRSALIRQAVLDDERKQFSSEQFDAEIAFLRRFAMERPAVALAQVGDLRQPD